MKYFRLKPIHGIFAGIIAIALLFFLPGCAPQAPQKAWLTDFDEAQKLAKKQNKNIFLYFSALDWDEASEKLKTDIFDTDEFLTGAGKNYVLVNLDFSRSLYEQALPPENATAEETAAADKISQTLEKRGDIAQKYSVMDLPSFFLLAKTGIVISKIDSILGIENPAGFLELLSQFDEKGEKINTFLKTIAKTKGVEKVTAIDGLFEETEPRFQSLLAEFFPLVLTSDPKNETGLLGKYELQNAYSQAMSFYSQGDPSSASSAFAAVAESEHLADVETQEALYFAAFFLAQSPLGEENQEGRLKEILSLLQRAYDVASESSAAPGILETMDNFTQELQKAQEAQNAPREDGAEPDAGRKAPQKDGSE
jgi:thioredoxin-related protein